MRYNKKMTIRRRTIERVTWRKTQRTARPLADLRASVTLEHSSVFQCTMCSWTTCIQTRSFVKHHTFTYYRQNQSATKYARTSKHHCFADL